MQAFVLAGGFATRLWPLTEKRAKPLLPLAGKPLLTWLVEKVPEGIPVTVSTNAVFAKDLEEWRKGIKNQELGIKILIEDAGHEDEKLGAVGAVAKWITENNVEDDVLLLAGDNYIGFSLEEFLGEFDGQTTLFAARDIGDREEAKKFGTVIGEFGGREKWHKMYRAKAFEEKPEHPQSLIVSTGCYIFPKDTLNTLVTFAKEHPDNIGGALRHFLDQGILLHYILFQEPWFDIGSFEAYLEATRILVGENVLDLRHPAAGPQPTIPQYTSILRTDPQDTDHENTFTGSVVVGQGSRVRRSRLRNVVLFEDCEIEDCILEDCIIDDRCTLMGVDLTGKMLRAGTTLVRPAA